MQSDNARSIVFYNGLSSKSTCGYCKTENGSISNGMWASSLTVEAYQDMIDRGWRRAGKYCYKSSMDKTCCPLYTIRCEALDFELSKSQKKVIKRVTTFLKSGECEKNSIITEQAEQAEGFSFMKYEVKDIQNHDDKMKITNTDYIFDEEQSSSVIGSHNSTLAVTNKEDSKIVVPLNLNCNSETNKETKKVKPGEGADPNLPSSKKKKILRIQKKLAKDPNFVTRTIPSQQKCLEEFIAENDSIFTPDGIKKLRIKLLKMSSTSDSLEDEYAVYLLYQTIIHGDKIEQRSREQFIRFLIDSPLKEEKSTHPDHPGYGSFHQQYWLGDKLIAVGVIDILPKCVSSVYLFYDPDYHNLVLGTYSSFREICLVRQLNIMSPDLKYYYMGFYIHSCPKMRYKAKLRPSFLLCPLRYTWHSIDKCIQKLDNKKNSTFDESGDIQDDDIFTIDNIIVLYRGSLMLYSKYKKIGNKENEDELIKEYKILIGPKLARKLIYCIMD